MITDNGYCIHSSSPHLVKCGGGAEANSLEGCQSACESLDSCVGFYLYQNHAYCAIIPSSPPSVCPDGRAPNNLDEGAVAQTSAELVERPTANWACYGKIGMLRIRIKMM